MSDESSFFQHLRALPDGSLTAAEVGVLLDHIEGLEKALGASAVGQGVDPSGSRWQGGVPVSADPTRREPVVNVATAPVRMKPIANVLGREWTYATLEVNYDGDESRCWLYVGLLALAERYEERWAPKPTTDDGVVLP